MKISLNTIKQYLNFELPSVDELVYQINQKLGQVEEVTDLAPKYKDVVIVKIVECEKHPNADKLSVCMIDDGGAVQEVERDDRGLVRVVCGAPNARVGIFAAWLPPKSTVPASFNDAEPFVLDARDLRGIKSNGMLAAADELALGSDHAGIIEIDPDEWKPSKTEIKPGASFAEAYGLDDVVIELENKMFTHRPDCFGQIGVAREIAGIFDKPFVSPKWYADKPELKDAVGLDLKVFNEAGEKVPRFTAVAFKDVAVKPSPLWLRVELVRLGSKSINNIVDATNYVMLLTAQPTHAYDYDKLRGATLGARMARAGEKVTLLNDKTYELTDDDIVIVDGEGIVGLGGVMGGGNSEVSAETKNIVLECANFDMYTVRKTSMRHGLFTDAVTRFSKGQSSLQQPHIISLLMQSTFDVAGGQQASMVFGQSSDEENIMSAAIQLEPSFINDRLGLALSEDQIGGLLENVEFTVSSSPLSIQAPFWRTDIELPEDIVEEVGRLYGFDKLPVVLPHRSVTPAAVNPSFELKKKIRDELSRAGANEVVTYSFVHENTLAKAGQDKAHAYQLSNAISPELQYYRLSLTPSLLDKVHPNIKAGHNEFALFEIGKTHFKGEMDVMEPDLPNEDTQIALVVAYGDKNKPKGAAYFYAKKYLNSLLGYTPSDFELVELAKFDVSNDAWGAQLTAPYEPKHSAVLVKNNEIWGVVGEFRSDVSQAFKLPDFCAGFDVHEDVLKNNLLARHTYKPLSRFPKVTQDISLKVPVETNYADVFNASWQTIESEQPGECDAKLEPLSIYQAESDTLNKTISLRLSVASYEKTLTDKEVNVVMDAVAETARQKFGAERI